MEELLNGGSKYGRLRIQERVGTSLINSLGNKSPWKSDHCGREGCQPCKSKEGSCGKRNVTYRLTCDICQEQGKRSVYIGETHRSWKDRSDDHEKALRDMDQSYATVTHHMEHHRDADRPRFTFKVDRSHQSSLQRQIMEALLIQGERCDMLLNKRGEWGINMLPEHTTFDERKQVTGAQQDGRRQQPKRARMTETDAERQDTKDKQVPESKQTPFIDQFSQRKKLYREKQKAKAIHEQPFISTVRAQHSLKDMNFCNQSGSQQPGQNDRRKRKL